MKLKSLLIPLASLAAVGVATFIGAESASASEAGRAIVGGLGRAGRA